MNKNILQGKHAVITGAASGMGRQLAIQLAAQGTRVLIADLRAAELDETKALIVAQVPSAQVFTYTLDVSNVISMQQFVNQVLNEHQFIDIVINNAGVALGKFSLEEVTLENFEWLMNINFWGVVYGSKLFLPHLRTRPEAWIVNTSSVFGMAGIAFQSPYCAAKFAVRGFTESLRMELRDTQITSIVVHPGGIKTNIVRYARDRSDEVALRTADAFDRRAARTSAADAAKKIIAGIVHKKSRVLIGSDATLIDFVVRLLPVRYTSIIGRALRRKLEV